MKFDVFLSYSSDDHVAVEALAHRLRADGLRVFLDRWYLVPGANWVRALEERLAGCGAVAVCLGREMGRWQERERAHALDRQAEAERLGQHFPVIPVLLPSLGVKGDVPPGFLRQLTWVDLRATVEDERGLAVLKRAIRGEPPGPDPLADGGNEATRRLRATLCPFRGLLYFREEDEAFFFGRTVSADRLLALVGEQSLVAVVGSSGAGKSSLVRAGLVPRLRRDRATVWEVVTLRPGDRPLRALAQALLPLLEPGMSEVTRLGEVERLAEQFAEGRTALRDVVGRVLEKQPGTDRLMLIVDQWEELVTQTDNADHRRRFIDALLEATQKSALSVVLTLRGDFFGRAIAEHRPLADRLQGGAVMPLGPMTVEELRESIERPANVAGLRIESGLVERMLTDAQDEPGHLPLLEFALRELWDRRQGNLLHVQAYEAVGGLAGAIADKAEGLIGKLGPTEQTEVQRLFLRLVRPGQGEKDARRRAAASEFSDAALPLIRRLSDERLLVTAGGPAAAIETVEVAHEALLHRWQRLRGWIDKDRQFMLWQQEVNAAAAKWHDGGRQSDFLLRGVPLAQARVWMKQRPTEVASLERDYVMAGTTRRRRVAGLSGASLVFAVWVIASLSLRINDERRRADQVNEQLEQLAETLVFDLPEKMDPANRRELIEKLKDKSSYYEKLSVHENAVFTEFARISELIKRGDDFRARNDIPMAKSAYERAFKFSERMVKVHPNGGVWQHGLSVSYHRLGSVERAAGRLAEAKQAHEQALAISEKLAKVDPANTQWQRDLSYSYALLAQVHESLSDRPSALRFAEASLAIAERLAKLDPQNATWQNDVKVSRALVARLKQ